MTIHLLSHAGGRQCELAACTAATERLKNPNSKYAPRQMDKNNHPMGTKVPGEDEYEYGVTSRYASNNPTSNVTAAANKAMADGGLAELMER
jgi:hypothetical protein